MSQAPQVPLRVAEASAVYLSSTAMQPQLDEAEMYAVITGDLVKSRDISTEQHDALLLNLHYILREVGEHCGALLPFEVFRGDSFQQIFPRASDAIKAAILIRLALKSERSAPDSSAGLIESDNYKPLSDARIGIGVGGVEDLRKDVGTSSGPAFVLSGHTLDKMKGSERLHIQCQMPPFQERVELLTRFVDVLITDTKKRQADILYAYLTAEDRSHASIAVAQNTSRANVSQSLKKTHYHLIDAYLMQLDQLEKEYLLSDPQSYEQQLLALIESAKKADYQPGLARAYASLGAVQQNSGELDEAEKAYEKALQANQAAGRKKQATSNLAAIGWIKLIRGDLNEAREVLLQALEISEGVVDKRGMAKAYNILGHIYQTQGDLLAAETFFQKALGINQAMDRKQGMAAQYNNLGLIYEKKSDWNKAEEFQLKALVINESLGNKQNMATNYGNLGNIYRAKDDLDNAESFQLKALKIDADMGNKHGMAISYNNLGLIHMWQQNISKAKDDWQQAMALYQQIGVPHEVEKLQYLLADLDTSDTDQEASQ